MGPARQRKDEMFVVRIWSEGDRPIRTGWRASVTHVSTGHRQFFTTYGELCEFLDLWRDPGPIGKASR